MYALFSIYLIQAGFSSLDDDPTVRDFLFNYLGQYKHSKLEEHRLLYAILQAILGRRKTGHSRALKKLPPEELQSLVLYTWPDDYRALRQYVRKTATGVEISLHHADHEPAHQLPFYTISSAAKLLGIPRTTLYRYVKEGKIETKQKDMGDKSDKSQLVILEEEFCRLKQQLDQQKSQDESDKMLFQYCAEASGIKPKSLQRQVQRLKKQGNSAEVIRQHFQQDAQRRLQDSDT